jgi:hypothetical protein
LSRFNSAETATYPALPYNSRPTISSPATSGTFYHERTLVAQCERDGRISEPTIYKSSTTPWCNGFIFESA